MVTVNKLFSSSQENDRRMSTAQVQRARDEKKQLEDELNALKKSIPASEAAGLVVKYVNNTNEPYLADAEANQWKAEANKPGFCSIL
jgi:hypothetical protein